MKRFHTSFFRTPSFAKLQNTDPNANPANTTDKGDAGDGGTGAGGEAGDKGGDKGTKETPEERVARADHERALADLNKYKREAEKLKQEKKDAEMNRLKEKEDWKAIAEENERKAKEADDKAARIENSYLNEKRFNALRSKCEALGLRPEAVSDLEDLDLNDIQIETTSTGKINVLGADKFATALKARKPHWFSDKQTPKVNTNGQKIIDSDGPISPADLLKAEAEAKKSGDMKPYYETHKKFLQQRAAAGRR